MKKGEKIQIKINGINEKGKSYSLIDNIRYYVNINSANNQTVEGFIGKIKSKKNKVEIFNCNILDYANRKNIIFPDQSKQCGGCHYQYYTYDEQITLKENNIFNKFKNINFDETIKSTKQIKYRNKMEFSFGNEIKDGPTILGLHKQNSFHDIVDVENCNLMDNNFNKIYIKTNDFFKKCELLNNNITFYHRITHIGYLRNFIIRKSKYTKSIICNLVTTSQLNKETELDILNEWKELLLNLELENGYKISGILHTITDNISDSPQSDNIEILYGEKDLTEKINNLLFKISPFSFFQTNTETIEKLYQTVIDYINDLNIQNPIIFDLFSGTGTIGQIVSNTAKNVYSIEIVDEAVKKAIENAKLNNIENICFLTGDVFEKIDELSNKNIKPDIMIIDPPRAGILSKTIKKLVEYNCKYLVYVSCNPNTLYTDVNELKEYGYTVKKARLVDMFPFTSHIETVMLLEKN